MNVSHLRVDEVTGQSVLFAPCRASRPFEITAASVAAATSSTAKAETGQKPAGRPCPFCPGNEERDLEVLCWPDCASDAWRVRIVRNKFPAITPVSAEIETAEDPSRKLMTGVHDVIVPTPQHNTCIALLPVEQLSVAIRVAAEHCKTVASSGTCEYVALFENHGIRAGASLPHPHMQVIAPARGAPAPKLEQWVSVACAAHKQSGKCSMCQMLERELAERTRIVFESEHFVALMPFAAVTPFGLRIVPKEHCPDFYLALSGTEEVRMDFAKVWKTVLCALRILHGDPDYNLAFMAPSVVRDHDTVDAAVHWFAVFDVRVNQPAGFELATGTNINPKLPEQAAKELRDAIACLHQQQQQQNQ